MGGEGAMAAANASLKSNRNLTAKRKERAALSGSYSQVKLKAFPEATPAEVEAVGLRIKEENSRLRKKQILIIGIVFLVLLCVIKYLL